MSKVIDVSSKLGEYMLKGWVLTDKICQNCGKVPLMRSPSNDTVHFCANCDGDPVPSSSRQSAMIHSQSQAGTTSEGASSASMDFTSRSSRPSTPLTEMSSALSSPVFAPPVDTAEILRRRQQSDTASTEIGKRLLKGWAMLADECPNHQCYGIPLVRPPKTGPEKDPRKECVICHTVYVDRTDDSGFQRLVPFETIRLPGVPSSAINVGNQILSSNRAKEEGKDQSTSQLPTFVPRTVQDGSTTEATLQTLDATTTILERSMRSLTEKLNFLSGNNVDVVMIGQTADAISKVAQALTYVKQLRWSEKQALGS